MERPIYKKIKEPEYPIPFCGVFPPLPTLITYPTGVLFRNPTRTFSHLASCNGYMVVYVSCHGDYIGTFPAKLYDTHSYAVVQTGGGDATGCFYLTDTDEFMRNMFGTNILYSFQHLLGIRGDKVPTFYKDLHYSTSDFDIGPSGEIITEIIPNKILSYETSDIVSHGMGVYLFDPAIKLDAGTALFSKDEYWDPKFTGDGITIDKFIDELPTRYSTHQNFIVVINSCASVPEYITNSNLKKIVRTSGSTSHYSKPQPGELRVYPTFPLIEEPGSKLPDFVKEHTLRTPLNWRSRKQTSRFRRLFKKQMRKATTQKKKKSIRLATYNTFVNAMAGKNYAPLPSYEEHLENLKRRGIINHE